MTIHTRPVVASLYSQSSRSGGGASGGAGGPSQPRSHPFSSVSLSPDKSFAVASGKDVLHVLRLSLDKDAGEGNRLEEIRSVRISQVSLRNMFVCN